ncbi:ankyrin repeat-containing domain protein [Paraphoma chrysanthemicola]|uniref:Ankyrin repeat-containing domain protein n=1 Tax=Paraphoma chrysanthemicola TaxID=798071 RepID=A0A8K0RKE4_9PLEO|nr:ankyrin repeat-containing domain protein [Paraphoma chrysanthemicola]
MSNLPEAEWNRHKEHIRQLYCIEQKGLQCVREEMKHCHGFDTTKSQYEKYFKRWKFRKSLSKKEWTPVRHKILARKREGKESDVYLEGVLMPAKKVKRGIGRYQQTRCGMNSTGYDHVSELQTPDGVTIATPIPSGSSSTLFEDLLISQYFASLLYQVSPQGRNTVYPASYPGATAVLSMHFTNTPELLVLPHWPSKEGPTSRPRSAIGTITADLRNDAGEHFRRDLELLRTLPENTEAFKSLQSMIFLASNNFLNSADFSIRSNIIDWLREEKNASLLRRLLSVGGPTAESTLEALYPFALEGQSTNIIKIFIDLGCDPNYSYIPTLDPYAETATTALGSACAAQNFELVCLLLAAGADPNKLSKHPGDDYDDELPREEDERSSALQLVETLMQSGALVHNLSSKCHIPLAEAIRQNDESVVRFLLSKGADVNLKDGFDKLPLGIAIRHFDDGFALRHFDDNPEMLMSKRFSIVRLLLSAGADLNSVSDHSFDYDHCGEYRSFLPFDNAAWTGCLPLLELLHTAGARPGRFALTSAIDGKDEDVVKFTLQAITRCHDSEAQKSALVQAVQSTDSEMFRFLFESSTNRYDSNTLSLAVQKAIPWKNYQTIQQLLLAGRRDTHFAEKLKPAAKAAILSGDLEILELLLSAGVKVSFNLLVAAFESSHESIIKRLFVLRPLQYVNERAEESEDDERSSFSRRNCECGEARAHRKKMPLLAAAAGFGNYEMVKHLLEEGAIFHGTLALLFAVRKRKVEMVAVLLEAGSPVNHGACDGKTVMTPLQAAVQTRQPSLVRMLLDNGADPEVSPLSSKSHGIQQKHNDFFDKTEPPLHIAVKQGDSEIAMMLLQAGADINNPQAKVWRCSALALAIRGNNQQMLDLVVAQGADMLDSSALVQAVEQQNFRLARTLAFRSRDGCKHRGNFGYEALCKAIWQGSTDMVKLLLSAGINPNLSSRAETALGAAINQIGGPATDMVGMLLQAGADPNGQFITSYPRDGPRTALVAAAGLGDVSIVTVLLKYGADPNANPKGVISRSPLQAACEAGKRAVVQLLLDHGADVNAPPAWRNGGTALQFAAMNGNPEIVLMLLKCGADFDASAARLNGRTALEGAAENGRLDTVKLLLNAGVSIRGPYEGQYYRAIQFARKKGYLPIVRELVAMAEPSL